MIRNEFKDFYNKTKRLLNDFAQEAGNDALNFYLDSFRNQGFTDKALERWPARKVSKLYLKKKTKSGQKAGPQQFRKGMSTKLALTKEARRANGAILVRSGRLRRGWRKDVNGLTIRISNSVPYAQVHNEGGNAGRGGKVKIKKRQMVGESEVLMNQFEKKFLDMMEQTFNNL